MADRRRHVEELIDSAQFLMRRTSGLSRMKDAGITGSQWFVVGHIFRNGGCTTNQTAAALNMTGSAITQLVNGLVAKGYVIRKPDPADKRSHRLTLSKESRKRIEASKKKRVQVMVQMFKALTDREFMQYLALNKKIVRGFSD